jgi:hypothetical protein
MIERACTAQDALRRVEPLASGREIPENVHRMAEQARQTNHPVRFLSRQAADHLTTAKDGAGETELRQNLIEGKVELLAQSLQLAASEPGFDHLAWPRNLLFSRRFHLPPSYQIPAVSDKLLNLARNAAHESRLRLRKRMTILAL